MSDTSTDDIEWSEDSLIILKCLECKRPTLFRLQICHEADDHDYRAKSCCRDCINDQPLYEIRFRKLDSALVNNQSVDFGCHVPNWAVRPGTEQSREDPDA